MNKFLSHYSIHRSTMALIPAKHTDYNTIVLEPDKQLLINQTPLQIIKQACLERFTTYDWIKEAVYKLTKFKRKVPIPINPFYNIYFFPTHATNDDDCCWISYTSVYRIVENPKRKKNEPSSIILFKNGQSLEINVSTYILKNQLKRTKECIYCYLESKKEMPISVGG